MDASSEQHQPVSSLSCPSCGSPLVTATAFCPTCGRPLAFVGDVSSAQLAAHPQDDSAPTLPATTMPLGPTASGAPGQEYLPGDQPSPSAPYQMGQFFQTAQTTPVSPTQTQPGVWAGQHLPTPTGMEALGATASVAPGKPMRSHRLRNTLTLISAVVIVALLAGGAYYLYAAFFNSPQAAARVLPDRTFIYVSVDLTAAANNNHHVTIGDLAQMFGVGATLKTEGLNWQQDVAPWVGRNVALAVYPTSNDSATLSNITSSPSSNPVSTAASVLNIGFAELFQSRDDAKAQAAMSKAANAQKQHGQTIKQVSYGGMTLYSVVSPGDNANNNTPEQTLFAGKSWAAIASSVASAEIIVDRINGQGATLASAPSFQDATNNLPASRFSTLYFNLRAYYNQMTSLAGPTQGLLDFPFVDTYPVAGGYLTWSALGMRAQLTFNAVKSAGIPNVSGNTINLSQFAPANALTYSGVGNLGALIRAYIAQLPTAAKVTPASVDPLEQAYGISSNAPVVQQPAATFTFAQGKTTASALLLHAPNASAAQTAFATIAHKNQWTLKATTVDDVDANAIYAPDAYPYPADPTTQKGSASNPEVGIEALVGQTLVIVTADKPANALDTIIKASRNLSPSLASVATFQSLVTQAPTNAATMTYYNVALAEQLSQQNGGQRPSGLATRIPALLATLVWNAQVNQTTVDVIIK